MPEHPITKQYISHLNLIAKGSYETREMNKGEAINRLTDLAESAIPPTGPKNPVAEHLRTLAKQQDEETNRYGGNREDALSATYRSAADEIERLHNGWGRANVENSDLRRGRSVKPANDEPVTADGKSHVFVHTYPTREERDAVARMAHALWQAHCEFHGIRGGQPQVMDAGYWTPIAEAAIAAAQHERDHEQEGLPEEPYYIRLDALKLAVAADVSNPLEMAEDFRAYLEGRS